MSKARWLPENTTLTQKEIATQLGLSHLSNFRRSFIMRASIPSSAVRERIEDGAQSQR